MDVSISAIVGVLDTAGRERVTGDDAVLTDGVAAETVGIAVPEVIESSPKWYASQLM